MSKLLSRHIFTSEAVSEGHPDKVCDQISDAILDELIKRDPNAHVACETAVGPNIVCNLGEINSTAWGEVDTAKVAAEVIRSIGYDDPAEGFSWNSFNYVNALHGQSPDINQGVSRGSAETQGAGDQGMMFGYATDETPAFMPATCVYAHGLLKHFAELRKRGEIPWLRPDSKSQLSIVYDNGRPVAIDTVVLSHQTRDLPIDTVRKELEARAREFLAKTGLLRNETKFHVNPTGKFVIGGPCGDSGVTGRKIIVDTYGGIGSHGGGAFSGKDPSKVDRSAAYYTRYAAKNIVAAGLAGKCEIQVSYAIGVAEPTSINASTFGTGKLPDEKIADILQHSGLFDFRPGVLTKELGLNTPQGWSYRESCNYGHFGRDGFPWERLDKVEALRSFLKG